MLPIQREIGIHDKASPPKAILTRVSFHPTPSALSAPDTWYPGILTCRGDGPNKGFGTTMRDRSEITLDQVIKTRLFLLGEKLRSEQ